MAALGGGATAFFGPEPTHTLRGNAVVFDGVKFPAESGSCDGSEDLTAGKQITVLDGAGAVAGIGVFGDGVLTGRGGCRLSFTVPDLDESEFFQLRTQSTLRPSTTYRLAELDAEKWHLEVQVGDADEAARESRADCLPIDAFSVHGTISSKLVDLGDTEVWMWDLKGSVTSRVDQDGDVSVSWGVGWMDKWLGTIQTASFGSVQPPGDSAGSTDLQVPANGTAKLNVGGSYVRNGMWGHKPTDVELDVLSAVHTDSGAELWCMAGAE